jgi:hypothetical protein
LHGCGPCIEVDRIAFLVVICEALRFEPFQKI